MYIIKRNSRKLRLIAFVCAALMALSFASPVTTGSSV